MKFRVNDLSIDTNRNGLINKNLSVKNKAKWVKKKTVKNH